MIRFTERRLRALMIAAGALTLAAGASAVGMVATGGQARTPSHTAAPFLCVAYAHTWGICIGPPTN